jgi:hypothetical protein
MIDKIGISFDPPRRFFSVEYSDNDRQSGGGTWEAVTMAVLALKPARIACSF